MGAVGADQVPGPDRLPPVRAVQGGGDTIGVLPEAGQPHPALDPNTPGAQFLAQHALRAVLREPDEAERHILGQGEIDLPATFTVDVDDLTAEVHGRVENLSHNAHALEDFECTGLHTNGFGILRRFGQRIDDPDGHAAPGELDGGGQPDRAGARDEHLGVGHPRSMPERHRP